MLYHWATETTVNEIYNEVHMTRVLHTARIINVDSVMFADEKIREMVSFELGKEIKIDVFRLVTSVGQRKKSQWGIEPQTFGFRAPILYHWAGIFLCPTLVARRKTSFFISLPSSKLTIPPIFPSTNITLSTLLILAICRSRVIWTSL